MARIMWSNSLWLWWYCGINSTLYLQGQSDLMSEFLIHLVKKSETVTDSHACEYDFQILKLVHSRSEFYVRILCIRMKQYETFCSIFYIVFR